MNHSNKWEGEYEYKGFIIYNVGERDWMVEPKGWSIKAFEKLKSEEIPQLETIALAKKWVREQGVKLNESDFL